MVAATSSSRACAAPPLHWSTCASRWTAFATRSRNEACSSADCVKFCTSLDQLTPRASRLNARFPLSPTVIGSGRRRLPAPDSQRSGATPQRMLAEVLKAIEQCFCVGSASISYLGHYRIADDQWRPKLARQALQTTRRVHRVADYGEGKSQF